jgi:hypothetical protein
VSADEDEIFYGGGTAAPIIGQDGVSKQYVAKNIILSDEFELAVAKPGELDENQDRPAFILTVKGVDNTTRAMAAVTLVFDPRMAEAIIKLTRQKYTEIPIEHR